MALGLRGLGRAVEQSDEPVEALELKMLYDGPTVINVRFAGYRCCSTDETRRRRGTPEGAVRGEEASHDR
jgi:hypothetical protein